MPGKLIFVEGIDGSGKSTLAKALHTHFQPDSVLLRFPSDWPIGKLIRQSFVDASLDRSTYLYLMVADAIDAERHIKKFLADGATIIADRHTLLSGYVYQQEDHHLDAIYDVQQTHEWLKPDSILIVDVPADVALDRLRGREKYVDRVFEHNDHDYYERLRQRYLQFARDSTWPVHIIDGTGTPIDVLNTALQALD